MTQIYSTLTKKKYSKRGEAYGWLSSPWLAHHREAYLPSAGQHTGQFHLGESEPSLVQLEILVIFINSEVFNINSVSQRVFLLEEGWAKQVTPSPQSY